VTCGAKIDAEIDAACASGYKQKIGDTPGWGRVGGAGGGVSVESCEGCAKLCDDKMSDGCRSYECSPTERRCNLNHAENPTRGSYKDYNFCSAPATKEKVATNTGKNEARKEEAACASGYKQKIGDSPGWGRVGGAGGGVSVESCEGCAKLCDDKMSDGCRSYECSPTERRCNLNHAENPTSGSYKDYNFCSRTTPAGFKWVKGDNGSTCDQTCANIQMIADASELNKLTTNELVGEAFKKAGYTCRSFHGKRSYPGTPFSKATPNDDCAPVIPGSSVVTNRNSHGHHSPLCYCSQGGF